MSGVSPDMRDIEKAAAAGDSRAKLAIDAFVEAVRHFIGAYLVVLGGCDVLAFTGGMGENGVGPSRGDLQESRFGRPDSRSTEKPDARQGRRDQQSSNRNGEIWIVPANEELDRRTANGSGFERQTKFFSEIAVMANSEAIGLIETKGIVAAVEALDAALKAANVQFVEQHKVGSGLVAITLRGDVAAVRAAVDAGAEAGGKVGEIVSVHVIARPHSDVAKMG